MLNKIILAILVLLIVSCKPANPNKEIDEGTIKDGVYENKVIGWTIKIPAGWKIIPADKNDANDKKGKEAMEKTSGQKINMTALKHLIGFQKDPFNAFAATSEPFVEEVPGDYEANNKKVNALLYQTLVDQGIKVDTSSGKEMIQNTEFNFFRTIVYGPDGKVILNQLLYSKLIKGLDFGVTICYNDKQNQTVLFNAWKNSHFINN